MSVLIASTLIFIWYVSTGVLFCMKLSNKDNIVISVIIILLLWPVVLYVLIITRLIDLLVIRR